MAAKRKRGGNPARQGWEPLEVEDQTELMLSVNQHPRGWIYRYRPGTGRVVQVLMFRNRTYNGYAHVFEDGSMHLDFKRNDRAAVRDWRHFQAIKNEVAGPDREAVEVFPPEAALVDGANQYHLWVLPPGMWSPLGFAQREVGEGVPPEAREYDRAAYAQAERAGRPLSAPGMKQRPWEPGIPTGLGQVHEQPSVATLSGTATLATRRT